MAVSAAELRLIATVGAINVRFWPHGDIGEGTDKVRLLGECVAKLFSRLN
jgi:hypothetical protein